MGGAAHADDLCTTASCPDTIAQQVLIINNFTLQNGLKLNSSKTEIIQISQHLPTLEPIKLPDLTITPVHNAKCLGIWWQHNLSADRAVQENISKARRAFFAYGQLEAFQGNLNPLSSSSIFESCVLPILLYGCETWLLNVTSLSALESFQAEIGRRILKLPSFFSTSTVQICLCWPSMATRILVRKLGFLAKLLSPQVNSISSHIFTSTAITDPLNISIIQQCRFLESITQVDVLQSCLNDPEVAPSIVKLRKEELFKQDLVHLYDSSVSPSSQFVAKVARDTSWRHLWDLALDKGVHGTRQLQRIIYLLSRPIFSHIHCSQCDQEVAPPDLWANHVCGSHPPTLVGSSNAVSLDDIIESLRRSNTDFIFNLLFH